MQLRSRGKSNKGLNDILLKLEKGEFEKGESSRTGKEKVENSNVRNRDLKCWSCQGVDTIVEIAQIQEL